jgi:uncharacterized protein (TIGR02611 family)
MKPKEMAGWVMRSGKRIAVTIIGFGLVAAGLVMLVIPGPGLLVIFAGFAVLATEYAWARSVRDETKRRARQAKAAVKRRRRKKR